MSKIESQTLDVQPALGTPFLRNRGGGRIEYSKVGREDQAELLSLAVTSFGHLVPVNRWMTFGQFAGAISTVYDRAHPRVYACIDNLKDLSAAVAKGVN